MPARRLLRRTGAVRRARQRAGAWTASRNWLELNGYPAHLDGARAGRLRGARRHYRPVSRRRQRPAGASRFLRRHDRDRSAASIRRPSAPTNGCAALDLVPVAEFQLITDTIRSFRTGLRGGLRRAGPDDQLYTKPVSEGRRYARHGALAAAVPRPDSTRCSIICRARRSCWSRRPTTRRASGSRRSRTTTRRARAARSKGTAVRRALQAAAARTGFICTETEWKERLGGASDRAKLTPFDRSGRAGASIDLGMRQGHNFAPSAPSRAPTCSRP